MVTSKTFERLSSLSPKIASEAGTSEEVVRKVLEIAKTDVISRRRPMAPPPPKGGILLREASRKYKIPISTLCDWATAGYIKTLKATPRRRYIDESQIKEIAQKYKSKNGRGNRTLSKILNHCPNNNSS